jgi:hypothetical protein
MGQLCGCKTACHCLQQLKYVLLQAISIGIIVINQVQVVDLADGNIFHSSPSLMPPLFSPHPHWQLNNMYYGYKLQYKQILITVHDNHLAIFDMIFKWAAEEPTITVLAFFNKPIPLFICQTLSSNEAIDKSSIIKTFSDSFRTVVAPLTFFSFASSRIRVVLTLAERCAEGFIASLVSTYFRVEMGAENLR